LTRTVGSRHASSAARRLVDQPRPPDDRPAADRRDRTTDTIDTRPAFDCTASDLDDLRTWPFRLLSRRPLAPE
jgi:hypothetical protein